MENIHQDPKVPPTGDFKDWPMILESVEEYIHGLCGVDNVPLKYMLGGNIRPKSVVDDAAVEEAGSTYLTYDEDMVDHATIVESTAVGTDEQLVNNGSFVAPYMSDITMVWNKLVAIFQTSETWVYCKMEKKHRDGKIAFRGVYDRYLGTINVNHMASNAERSL